MLGRGTEMDCSALSTFCKSFSLAAQRAAELQPLSLSTAGRCVSSGFVCPGPWRNPTRSALKLSVTPDAKLRLGVVEKGTRYLYPPQAFLALGGFCMH